MVEPLHPDITPSEAEVLELYALLGNDKEVAARLGKSPHTVRNQLASVETKLGVAGRAELLLRLLKDRGKQA